jgi:hypothetical protein
MFDKLVELQTRIHAIADRSETLLGGERDIDALGQARWELARAFREYQLFQHGCIFGPLERAGGPDASRAARMKAECSRFGEEIRQYVVRWIAVSVLDHWDEFRAASLGLISRIRAHLAAELAAVADLLRTSSRAA